MIRPEMGKRYKSENGRSAWDSLYDITPQQEPLLTSTLFGYIFVVSYPYICSKIRTYVRLRLCMSAYVCVCGRTFLLLFKWIEI
jgi:hypothetical protein